MKDFLLRRAQQQHSPAHRWLALLGSAILFWAIVPAFLLWLSGWLTAHFSIPTLPHSGWLMGLGLLLMAVGALIDLWVIYYQHTEGRGTPSPFVPTQRLVQDGPFAYSRNPMYVGTLTIYTGLGLLTGSVAMLALVALGALMVHSYVVLVEEPELEARFGEEYRAYKRRVPRWLSLRRKHG